MKKCEACGREEELLWDGRFCGYCTLCDYCVNLTKFHECDIKGIKISAGFWRCGSYDKKNLHKFCE